jgi:hypothetical protein
MTGVGFDVSSLRADLDLGTLGGWGMTCGTLPSDLPRVRDDLDLEGAGCGTV